MKESDNKLSPLIENISPYSFDVTIEKLSLIIQGNCSLQTTDVSFLL